MKLPQKLAVHWEIGTRMIDEKASLIIIYTRHGTIKVLDISDQHSFGPLEFHGADILRRTTIGTQRRQK